GDRVLYALGDDRPEHAARDLYAHGHRGQWQPHAHHHGRTHGRGSRAGYVWDRERVGEGNAGRLDELQRHDQPDGRLHRPGHAERERPAQRRQRQLHSGPGDRVLHALGDDRPEHAARDLYAHGHRGQWQPHAHHHGRTHGRGSRAGYV